MEQRKLEDVVESLRNARNNHRHCSLLIGAGCSVSANIPLAGQFVDIIKKQYPNAYERAAQKGYPHCMAGLAPGERRDLITKFIDEAPINWAHLAIAQLMRESFIDRVLTTNFDLLVTQACATVGIHPAVYDFAASQDFRPEYIADQQAIFHLHGQRTGFTLLNTTKEVAKHKDAIAPLFEDAGRGRVWIVVGYSGDNDPVIDHLAKVPQFDHNLYWVGYKDNPPAEYVRTRLLSRDRYAWYVPGHDADDFFVLVAQRLQCFPPSLLASPLEYVEEILGRFTEYSVPGVKTKRDVTHETRNLLQTCREFLTSREPHIHTESVDRTLDSTDKTADTIATAITREYMSGEYEKVLNRFPDLSRVPPGIAETVALSALGMGNIHFDDAQELDARDAVRRYESAIEKYRQALQVKPDYHDALYNWGLALRKQADLLARGEAGLLLQSAVEKFELALKFQPDDPSTLASMGYAFLEQASLNEGAEADRLFEAAVEKFRRAVDIQPDDHVTLNNWGLALFRQARQKHGAEADPLLTAAVAKYKQAVETKPDYHEALYNWGLALYQQAKLKEGAEADRLFEAATDKYEQALRAKPEDPDTLNDWGNTLIERAKRTQGEEKERLLATAGEILERACKVEPTDTYNLACLRSLQGRYDEVEQLLRTALDAGTLPDREHLEQDPDLKAIRRRKWFKQLLDDVDRAAQDKS